LTASGFVPETVGLAFSQPRTSASGLAAPFLGKMLREKRKVRVIAAEPPACPSLTRGRYAYDFLDTARMLDGVGLRS